MAELFSEFIMILFSESKLNLGLRVVAKRRDGYHNIQSIFLPFSLYDVLEVQEANSFEYVQQGCKIETNLESNLCYKTWAYFAQNYGLPAVKIYHQKSVPIGAGLGGGSANVASLIKYFNQGFALGLSLAKQIEIAAKLSADAPFFLYNSPALVTGLGELVEPIDFSIPAEYRLVLCVPEQLRVSTVQVFSKVVAVARDENDLRKFVAEPIYNWANKICNDFEAIVFAELPILAQIKAQFYADGAIFASMTGTGAGIYAIFDKSVNIVPENYPNCNLYTAPKLNWQV